MVLPWEQLVLQGPAKCPKGKSKPAIIAGGSIQGYYRELRSHRSLEVWGGGLLWGKGPLPRGPMRMTGSGALGAVAMRPVHAGRPLGAPTVWRLSSWLQPHFHLPPPPLPVMNFVDSGAVQLRRVNSNSALCALPVVGSWRMGARAAALLATWWCARADDQNSAPPPPTTHRNFVVHGRCAGVKGRLGYGCVWHLLRVCCLQGRASRCRLHAD